MSNTFFTADTHFNNERTMVFSRRPFSSVKDMNKALIESWNSVVHEDDVVYHLGDFSDGEDFSFRHDLNGTINLVVGNYERDGDIEKAYKHFNTLYLDEVLPFISDEIELNLVHEPTHMEPDRFNLFGHVHQLCMVKRFQKPSLFKDSRFSTIKYQECLGLNVGVDCHNFKPISLDVVKFYENAITKHYDHEVFIGSPYLFTEKDVKKVDLNRL